MNSVLIVLVLFAYIAIVYAGEGNYNQAELMRVQDPKSASVASRFAGIYGKPKVYRSPGKSTFKICNTQLQTIISLLNASRLKIIQHFTVYLQTKTGVFC